MQTTKPNTPRDRAHHLRVAAVMRRRIGELLSQRERLRELYDRREEAFCAGQTALGDEIVEITKLLWRYRREVNQQEFEPQQESAA